MKLSNRVNAAIHPWMIRYLMRTYRREIDKIKLAHPDLFGEFAEEIEMEHLALWRKFDRRVTGDWFRLLSRVTGKPDAKFVPSTIYYGAIERILNNCNKASFGIEDKNLMSFYVPRELRANCILRYSRGCFFDDDFSPLNKIDAQTLLRAYDGDVIGKIAEGSSGGHSVELFHNDAGGRKIGKQHELTVDWITGNVDSYVVQERLVQEPEVSQFNPASINTCRIMTYRKPWSGEVHVGASMLRVGCGDEIVDNISSGGMSVGVSASGEVAKQGFSADFSILKFCGAELRSKEAFSIPGFSQMCNAAMSVARKVPDFNILGFDVMQRNNGSPCIVEINATSLCAIEVQQSGPMFGEDTEELVEWCLSHGEFDRFDHIRTCY